jgi:hypothetical protein
VAGKCSLRVVTGLSAVVPIFFIALSQGVAQIPAQNPPGTAQDSSSPRIPDAPSPIVPASESSAEAIQQGSSSSSQVPSPLRYWSSPDPDTQVTVLENTLLRVRTNQPLSTRQTRAGASLLFTLSEDVGVDGVLIIPRGATIRGTVVESKQSGTLAGSPDLILKLTSLDLEGRTYPVYTYQFKVTGASKTKPTETKIKGGAVIGAVVGGIFSGSAKGETTAVGKLAGVGTGAALGAGVGAAVAAATPGPILTIPAESEMDFYLSSPISVVPASEVAARRLSEGLVQGGPVLYVRGETP